MEHGVGVSVAREDAVEHHHVEVDVEVHAGAKALNESHSAARRVAEAGGLGPGAVAREDRLDEDAAQRGEHRRLEGRERA